MPPIMSESRLQHWLPVSLTTDRQTFAAGAIVLWVLMEVALRRGLVPLLAGPLGTGRGADSLVLAFLFPLIALAVAWWGLQNGIDRSDWEYTISIGSVGAGIAGWAGSFVLIGGLTLVYVSVLGIDLSVGAVGSASLGIAGAPTWALAVFLVGNGVVVPISEELAWRGVIQTSLADASGTTTAVVGTALAFVLKHLLVDLSAPLSRVTSLVVIALVFGVLRARYGTASSTVAHVATNIIPSALLVLG